MNFVVIIVNYLIISLYLLIIIYIKTLMDLMMHFKCLILHLTIKYYYLVMISFINVTINFNVKTIIYLKLKIIAIKHCCYRTSKILSLFIAQKIIYINQFDWVKIKKFIVKLLQFKQKKATMNEKFFFNQRKQIVYSLINYYFTKYLSYLQNLIV